MAWIPSHQSLARHPKLFAFASELGVSHVQAVGHLHFLWWWALDHAPDGDLSRYGEGQVALAGEWIDDPSVFWDALTESGFVVDWQLHDWADYAGKVLLNRKSLGGQARAERAERDDAGRFISAGQAQDDPASPAKTKSKTKSKKELEEERRVFEEDFWKKYPQRNGRRLGKDYAWSAWQRLSKSDQAEVLKALPIYAAECNGYPKDAHRWLKGKLWKEFLEPVAAAPKVDEYRDEEGYLIRDGARVFNDRIEV